MARATAAASCDRAVATHRKTESPTNRNGPTDAELTGQDQNSWISQHLVPRRRRAPKTNGSGATVTRDVQLEADRDESLMRTRAKPLDDRRGRACRRRLWSRARRRMRTRRSLPRVVEDRKMLPVWEERLRDALTAAGAVVPRASLVRFALAVIDLPNLQERCAREQRKQRADTHLRARHLFRLHDKARRCGMTFSRDAIRCSRRCRDESKTATMLRCAALVLPSANPSALGLAPTSEEEPSCRPSPSPKRASQT